MLIDSKRPFLFISVFLITSLTGIITYQQYLRFIEKNILTIYTGAGTVKIPVEYATTPEEWQKGLMNHSSLNKNSGMLFIFPDEKIRDFWMKNTLIPLEIMFINTKGRINEVITMKPCAADTKNCPIYASKEPARFVIEVNTRFAQKNKIMEGDILEISGF